MDRRTPDAEDDAPDADAPDDGLTDQQRMDAFYAATNAIAYTLTMSEAEWTALSTQEPEGGQCNNTYIGDRYTWFEADALKVEVTDTSGAGTTTWEYPDIGVKKKSFCGSISSDKPSLNVDLAKYDDDNEDEAESQIGTTRLTLNNSAQDDLLLRQCVGYHLFRVAGLPASRCNIASLTVHMPDADRTEWVGVYVNVEPIKKKYLKNPANAFAAGADGTLYEISTHDIDLSGDTYNDYKGYADDYARQDYGWAALQMDADLESGIEASIDVDQFLRYWAMEAITQHRDGYTRNITNTYIYNDHDLEDASSLPPEDITFAFLPWGIDKIMTSDTCWQLFCCSRVTRGLFPDPAYLARVNAEVQDVLDTFAAQEAGIDTTIQQLAASANTVWTGDDPILGENDTAEAQAYLEEWVAAAIAGAVASIDGGANNSCASDCFQTPEIPPCNADGIPTR